MPQRRFYRFVYYNGSVRKDRPVAMTQTRDPDAGCLLAAAVMERGCRYEGPIFNYPEKGPDLVPVDLSCYRPNDLIICTTRPPKNDRDFGNRRPVPRSFTTLEDRLFQGPVAKWFATCARTDIVLTPAAARVSPEIARRQSIEFRHNGGASYKCYGSPVAGEWTRFGRSERNPKTAAFLFYAEHAWENGPAFLCAFGMGGTDTLIWCYLLKTKFSHLLCSTPFVMAEMRTGGWPERPESMRFADSWDVDILGVAKPESSEDNAA